MVANGTVKIFTSHATFPGLELSDRSLMGKRSLGL
jgi:hypothetical protein